VSAALKLAVFDLDGTLVDSLGHIVGAMAQAFTAEGLSVPATAAVRSIVGMSLESAINALDPQLSSAQVAQVTASFKDAYHHQITAAEGIEPLITGARECLLALDAAGVLLGIATGKGRRGLIHVLEAHGLRDLFVTLQSANDAPGKPNPTMLLQALDGAGVTAAQSVMIGDTSFDLQMARNANVPAIGVTWGYHDRGQLWQCEPSAVIDQFQQLPATVQRVITGSYSR
jgi:phosphoglycolate phosphatase